MAPCGACEVEQCKVRSSEVTPNVHSNVIANVTRNAMIECECDRQYECGVQCECDMQGE